MYIWGKGRRMVSGFSSFLLKWREFWSPVFWKEKYLSLWNIHVISFLESQEYKEVTQSCIFSINRCYHKRKFPALTQFQGSSCTDRQLLHGPAAPAQPAPTMIFAPSYEVHLTDNSLAAFIPRWWTDLFPAQGTQLDRKPLNRTTRVLLESKRTKLLHSLSTALGPA